MKSRLDTIRDVLIEHLDALPGMDAEDYLAGLIDQALKPTTFRPGTKDQVWAIVSGLTNRPNLLWQVLDLLAHGPPIAGPWCKAQNGSVYERRRSPFMPEHVGDVPARAYEQHGSFIWFAYPNHTAQRTGRADSLAEAQDRADELLRSHNFILIPGAPGGLKDPTPA